MTMGFTHVEDSATLGSDMSAISGLRKGVRKHCYCYFHAKMMFYRNIMARTGHTGAQ